MSLVKDLREDSVRNGMRQLVSMCHSASKKSGWWNDLTTGEPLELTQEVDIEY